MIRKCVAGDYPWMLEVAKKNYPDFNAEGSKPLMLACIASEKAFVIRGEHGWAFAMLQEIPWLNHKINYVDLVALDKTRASIIEMVDILKEIKELGQKMGAAKMRLCALDEIGDLACFVNRLGGSKVGNIWEVI